MTPDNATAGRALRLFDRYVDLPEDRRAAALAELARTDPALHRALTALLDADIRPHAFASPLHWLAARERARGDAPPGAAHGAAHGEDTAVWRRGTRIGAWCVDAVIGIGGMGVVYAAHRADGWYQQDIALKTIRAELVSPALRAAFARERQHLARLQHPAIVSLLDAGVADNGQPWLAMRRVAGEPIDHWCDAHGLDLRARVGLLVEACHAVEHAHALGILHQDLKPANLLVTPAGQVTLLDFGLSALLPSHAGASAARLGASVGYTAPDVFGGDPPGVAVDVYALGVILYRLICDGWPLPPSPLPSRAPPRPPSLLARSTGAAAASVARVRGLRDTAALVRALRGDLDAIALRAVAADPGSRYPGAQALAEDLSAWLARAPVRARGERWPYRAWTFVRGRRRALLALACAGLVAAGAGVALEAQRRARDAADASATLARVFEASLGVASLSSLGNAPLSSRELLVETERRLRGEAGGDRPALLARGLAALARTQSINGDYAQAARLAGEARTTARDAVTVARADAVLAQLLNLRSRHARAERRARAALHALPRMRGVEDDLVALDLRMQLARARWGKGDTRGAIAELDGAVALAERLDGDGVPALAELLGQRGYAQAQLFRFAAADADLRRALALAAPRSPLVASTVRGHLASLLILTNRRAEALRQASALLAANRRLFGDAHPETARAWAVLGKAWYYRGNDRHARAALDHADTIFTATIGLDHPDAADVFVVRSAIAYNRGDFGTAVAISREGAAHLVRAYGPAHEASLKRRTDLAALLLHQGRELGGARQAASLREARDLLSDILRTGERQGLPMGYARDEYAETLLHFGRVDQADRQAARAIREMSALFGADSDYPTAAWLCMVKVRTAQGRYDQSDAIAARLLSRLEPPEESPYDNYMLREMMLDNAIARGDPARIRAAWAEAARIAYGYGFVARLASRPRPPGMARPRGR